MDRHTTSDFTLQVEGVNGSCPAGERYAQEQIANERIPVLSCEGPCLRGDIARRAADIVSKELPGFARACHAEAFFVPHSAMSRWVRTARNAVMIDGCFLKCHGRVLRKLVPADSVWHFDALALYRKHMDVFDPADVPEQERDALARQIATALIRELKEARARTGAG